MVLLMLEFTTGNLLDADTAAVVNTVNTVGVMGKGIALMFKEAFPENFRSYEAACKAKKVKLGEMFVTERVDLLGPKYIINFPTKAHWRFPSKLEWIEHGLNDLKRVIESKRIKSIALPPLGAGNGGLEWDDVRELIVKWAEDLTDVRIVVYAPTAKYQNVAKRTGVEKLTPARALIAELVRRYSVLGIECTLLEVQKLGYLLERHLKKFGPAGLDFEFRAHKYGPYSDKLKHMLNGLDGSYLHCDRRLADAGPFDIIRFDESRTDVVGAYLKSAEAKPYRRALEETSALIDGFESPLGMELLSTVDWLLDRDGAPDTVEGIRKALAAWTGGTESAERKLELFDNRVIGVALESLTKSTLFSNA